MYYITPNGGSCHLRETLFSFSMHYQEKNVLYTKIKHVCLSFGILLKLVCLIYLDNSQKQISIADMVNLWMSTWCCHLQSSCLRIMKHVTLEPHAGHTCQTWLERSRKWLFPKSAFYLESNTSEPLLYSVIRKFFKLLFLYCPEWYLSNT